MSKPWQVAFLMEKLGIQGTIVPMSFDASIINSQKKYQRTGINQYMAEYINKYLFRSLWERWKDWEFKVPTPISYLQKCINRDLLPLTVEARLNKVVNAGLLQTAKRINGNFSSTDGFEWNAIGTGTNEPDAADTDLQTVVSPRKAIGEAFEDGFTSLMQSLYGETENNSASLITESGFFSALTGPDMLNRQKFTGIDHSAAANTALTMLGAILVSE